MNIDKLFSKSINRYIEGVIKADDETNLRLEIDEYVLTNEIAKQLEDFFDSYKELEGINGVWLSGFFGCGKSHLLKILAYILENRSIDGTPAVDLFLPKCADNEFLRGDLKRIADIPSKSVLFNIDQKADAINKKETDALLSVFIKVFDEMCGYYGKQGHIAQFERHLDSRGLYEKFKQNYKNIAGIDWEKGREQAILESGNINKAYIGVVGAEGYAKEIGSQSQSKGIIDKYRDEYKVSIEDFANLVNDYINSQNKPNFRLNFFVDEVGQYIGGDIKLMLNLQTIAESLATKCKGKAWIIVTAQEELGDIIGEMSRQQGHDFSKIQARFRLRIKLTSSDVDEVIQKRLLAKNEEGIENLSSLYHKEVNNFKTLFDFTDGATTYQNYKDRDHFISCYPFVPYQYALFQTAIRSLSEHNAFEGRHSSVGERSILAVFQQVVIDIAKRKLGEIATFDQMFEGIRSTIKAQNLQSILLAEDHLNKEFAIRLLKALFLVKYVKGFNATVRNLCVLMTDSFGQNIPALKKQVEEALNLLEQQTYIQRSGDLYEFLTSEEKDIEQEIKNTEIDETDLSGNLVKLIFDNILKTAKIRSDDGIRDYKFSRKLDENLSGRDFELTINVITPLHKNHSEIDRFRAQSMGISDLIVVMPADDRFVKDLIMHQRTEKYYRQNVNITQKESAKRILSEKMSQNHQHWNRIHERVHNLLGKSKMFVNGEELDIGGESPETRMTKGFQELINRVYTQRKMLKSIMYTEKDISTFLQKADDVLFAHDSKLDEPEQEIIASVKANDKTGLKTTIKTLSEKFEQKPYGWPLIAIQVMLAKLYAKGKVEFRLEGNLLEDSSVERALLNTHGFDRAVINPQIDFTQKQVRQLKEFYEDFFNSPPNSNEPKALGMETATAFDELNSKIDVLMAQKAQYPFLSELQPLANLVKELRNKPYSFYLTDLEPSTEKLLDNKEELLDPIRNFMGGQLKKIYDEAQQFLITQHPNFSDLESSDIEALKKAIGGSDCFKGKTMQEAKSLIDSLNSQIKNALQEEIKKATQALTSMRSKLTGMEEFKALKPDQQRELTEDFDSFDQGLEQQKIISGIRDAIYRFENENFPRILGKLSSMSQPSVYDKGQKTDGEIKEAPAKCIPVRTITPSFDGVWLKDESDVEQYIAAFKKALMDAINKGNRIQI